MKKKIRRKKITITIAVTKDLIADVMVGGPKGERLDHFQTSMIEADLLSKSQEELKRDKFAWMDSRYHLRWSNRDYIIKEIVFVFTDKDIRDHKVTSASSETPYAFPVRR